MKEIIIKPVTKSKFSGISSYTNSRTTIGVEMSLSTGAYKTGLTAEEEREFEKLLDLKTGQLGKRSEWWGQNIAFKLNNGKPTRFTFTEDTMDIIKERVLLNSSKVAKSELDINAHTEFYIYNPEESAKVESIGIDLEITAGEEFNKLPVSKKRDVLRLYGKSGVDTFSEELVKTELWKLIRKDYKAFLDILKDKTMDTKALIEKLLEKSLIKKTASNHYMYSDEHIGMSVDDVVGYLNDPKNQKFKLILQNKLKGDKAE
jgi:hypothetical protein